MATRTLTFINKSDTLGAGYIEELAAGDDVSLGKITLSGVGGIAIDGGGQRATNFADPTGNTDLATKSYVDTNVSGLLVRAPVRAATTSNVGLTGTAPNTVDGVTLAANDRILVKNQTTGSQNGIYFVQTLGTGANGTWVRALDADTSAEVKAGLYVYVDQGTTQADTAWVLTTDNPITLDTTSLTFTQFSGLGQIVAGNGLTKTGNTLDIGAGNGITVNADDIAVRLATNSGLQFSSGQLEVDVDTARGINKDATGVFLGLNSTNPGLAFTSTYVDVKYDSARGITPSSTGIGVNIGANVGLAFTANALGVVVNAAQAVNVGASGIGISLNGTNPGLAFTSNTLDVKYGTTGAIQATATGIAVRLEASNPSLQISSNELGIKFDASGGLEKVANGTKVKIVSTDRLSLGASGLDVVGLPSLFEINGVAVSSNVTAANLDALTGGGSTTLHSHPGVGAVEITGVFTAGAAGVTKGQGVYVSAANVVLAGDCTDAAKSQIIGVCNTTAASTVATTVLQAGRCTAVLSGATPGAAYYLSATGGPVVFSSLPAAARVIRLGFAHNATDLLVNVQDFGKKIA